MSLLQRLKRKIKRHFPVIQPERIPVKEGELLAGKVALITGGGSGIGFGIAKAFRNEGARVVITGRTEETLSEAARKLGVDSCAYVVWDAGSVDRMEERFNECVSKFGRVDILVNNAGYHGNQNFFTVSESDYDRTFDTNIKYVFFLSQRTAKYMIAHEIPGHILNISSASSMKPAWSPYEISKWACRGFTRGLARELSPYHIVVNGIAPGPSATKMSHWNEGDPLNWGGEASRPEGWLCRRKSAIWPCSSPATSERISSAKPSFATAEAACLQPTSKFPASRAGETRFIEPSRQFRAQLPQ